MDSETLRTRLIAEEGWRSVAYEDSVGVWTIGVGFNLQRADARTLLAWVGADYDAVMAGTPLAHEQIERLFDRCLTDAAQSLRANVPGFDGLPETARCVLTDMAFNLGWPRLRGFAQMLAAVQRRDWGAMADEMLDSLWARQVGRRAQTLAAEIRALERETRP